MKPRILISNDDGIDSPFLPSFANALAKIADIQIVVPSREQSWIGRAYSRHSDIEVKQVDFHNFKCHTVSGTPSDCVNLALQYLCDTPPDAVVSGLNIGQNVAYPLLWSSGTFAAAVEAAGWGFPAFAFSMRLEKIYYEACRVRHVPAPEALLKNLTDASEHAAKFISETLSTHNFSDGDVINVNYPIKFMAKTEFKKCVPALAKLSSLYKKVGDGKYTFSYALGKTASPNGEMTDIECLENGLAGVSYINVYKK